MNGDYLLRTDDQAAPLAVWPQRSHRPDSAVLPAPAHRVGAARKITSGHSRYLFAAGSHESKEKLDGMNRVPGEIEVVVLFHGAGAPSVHTYRIRVFRTSCDLVK